jgi:signal peptidase I
MTFNQYILIVCIIIYALLSLVSVAVIVTLTKMTIRLVRHGVDDEVIIKEYIKAQKKGRKKSGKTLDTLLSVFLCVVFAVIFGFSLYVNVNENKYFEDIPTVKVVQSDSMSKKHEKNVYLTANHLNNQFDTFDVIFVYKAPAEAELKLYDIIVYEMEYQGETEYVVHRIVGIEEPNEKHPAERLFQTQGDAVARPDANTVKYSQIKAIYRDERIPFVGSFIIFMQSPAGWMCMILMLAATIATPIIDKKLEKERNKRLYAIAQKRAENGQAQKQQAPIYLYPVYYDPAYGIPFTDIAPTRHVEMPTQTKQKRGRK